MPTRELETAPAMHASRAWRNWRTSWISREVITLGAFAGIAQFYAAAIWFAIPQADLIGAAAVLMGCIGVLSSAKIYMLKARPAWNLSNYTIADFFLTAFSLGSILVAPKVACALLLAQAALHATRYRTLETSRVFEHTASAELLTEAVGIPFRIRMVLTLAAALAAPLAPVLAFALALAGEITGRWVFFASVVPVFVG